ncbi:hypothetical protein ES708_14166 [subsurface metagenome]
MIQPFSYIIRKRVNDLKKCISNESGMGLGKEKKGLINLLFMGMAHEYFIRIFKITV